MLGGLGAALLLVPIKDLARTPLSASGSIGSPAYTFVKQGIPYRLRRHRFKNVTGRFRRRRNIKDQQQLKNLPKLPWPFKMYLYPFCESFAFKFRKYKVGPRSIIY